MKKNNGNFTSGKSGKVINENGQFTTENKKIRNVLGLLIAWVGYLLFVLLFLSFVFEGDLDMFYVGIVVMCVSLFGFTLMPLLYETVLHKWDSSSLRLALPLCITIFTLTVGTVLPFSDGSIDPNYTVGQGGTQQNENTGQNEVPSTNNLNLLDNTPLKENFVLAAKAISMDVSKVKELKKVTDWNDGPRYSFSYENTNFILSAYDDGSVSSITIGSGLAKIYLKGYEPYNVNDYILTIADMVPLQMAAEASVKGVLNYPDSASFDWLMNGGYGRKKDYYIVSGKVNAKNAFGMTKDSEFYVEMQLSNGVYKETYLVLGGKKYSGTDSIMDDSNRKEIVANDGAQSESKEITIEDGKMGEYGKVDDFDGLKEIRYYLPAGKYKVESLSRYSQFFIESIQLHKEDGWDTATTYRTVTLDKTGAVDTIEITSGQCISLVINTRMKLTKIS